MKSRIEDLKNAREDLLQILKECSSKQLLSKLYDSWTVKDVVAHIAAWEANNIDKLDSLVRGTEPTAVKIQEFNDRETSRRASLPLNKVVTEFSKNSLSLIKAFEDLPNELWDRPFWHNKKETPQKAIQIETNHIRKTHLPDILRFLGKSSV